MKKLMTVILCMCFLISPFYVSADSMQLMTVNTTVKLLNYGEIPEEVVELKQSKTRSLNNDEQIYQYIREQMLALSSEIKLIDYYIPIKYQLVEEVQLDGQIAIKRQIIDSQNVQKFFGGTINYYPELFHVNNSISYRYSFNSSDNQLNTVYEGYIYSFIPSYNRDSNQYQSDLKQYNTKIDYIISGIGDDWSDLEKVLYVHDYLVAYSEYDLNLFSNDQAIVDKTIYNSYDFLITGVGVCQAYTQAFIAIMRELGINCTAALDDLDNHIWNVVEIDGQYYHLDLTHDDPLVGSLTNQNMGAVKYDHFLLTSEEMKNNCYSIVEAEVDGEVVEVMDYCHEEWYTIMPDLTCDDRAYLNSEDDHFTCTSTRFQSGYAWNDSESRVVNSNDKWYYINHLQSHESELLETPDLLTENSLQIYKFNSLASGYYYNSYYGVAEAVGTTVYHTTLSSVRAYDTLTKESYVVKDFENATIQNCVSAISYDKAYRENTYVKDGKLAVFFGSNPIVSDNGMQELAIFPVMGDTNDDGTLAAGDLVNARNVLLSNGYNFNWAVLDTGGNIGVDLLDFLRLKKSVAYYFN